jgi:hypothetical protein
MAIGDLGATNIFSLGTGFNVQSSSVNRNQDITEVLSSIGDIACQTPFNAVITASAEYEVCGSQTLALALGSEIGGYIVRSVELSQSAGQAPTVAIEGLSFPSATVTARTYAISQAINIAAISPGLTTPSTGLEPTEVSHRWECEITQSMGSDGQVKYAVSRTPKYTYTESGLGTLASAPTKTGMVLESFENSDSNQETDTYTCTFTHGLTSVGA